MRISHVCLFSAYTEGLLFQENVLADLNRRDGHDVLVAADCHRFEEGRLVPVPPEDRTLANGIRLVRLPFDRLGPGLLTDKVRKARALAPLLEEFRPDVILYHGVVGWELRTVGRYKRRHPGAKLYLDSHEDRLNSGRTALSRLLQYKGLTRRLLAGMIDRVEKVFYVSGETRDFLREMYRLPEEKMEFFPLGGLPVAPEDKARCRREVRERLGFDDDRVIFLHSGKLDAAKRTLELLEAFRGVEEPRAALLIAGSIPPDREDALSAAFAADPRVRFLGWQSGAGLIELMCACDAYVQPGSQSASLQTALCCGLPVLVYPHPSHAIYVRENGYFAASVEEIRDRLARMSRDPGLLKRMAGRSAALARELLDYNRLAARLYR